MVKKHSITRDEIMSGIKHLVNLKMRKITIYRDDSTTQVVYDNVKHIFWTANNSVLVIAQYTNLNSGEHRYIAWPRERICWFKDEKGL